MTEEPVAGVSGHRRWRLAVLVTALIAAAGISTPAQARSVADPGAGAAGTDTQELTGFAASVLTRPSAVRGTDGRLHIAYELVLTGATPFAVDVEQVEVRDASTDRVLLSLAGGALASRMNPVGGTPAGETPAPTTLIGASGSAIVWLDVGVRRKANLPDALEHRVVGSTRPLPGEESIPFTSLVGRVSMRARGPLKLGPPVRSGIWGAGEACCDNNTHHRRGLLVVDGDQVVPQRFAIDWMMLDEQHRAWVGDPHSLSSYLSYGQPLIAAAAGKVVTARDEFPDQPPPDNPTPPPLADLPGNHVTLRVARNRFMIYAHMKPGSVRVRVGERVRRGQVLEGSVTAATRPRHTSISRSRPRAVSSATACRSSSNASGSWARSPRRTSRTRSSACGPTDSCPLPQPVGRVNAAERCRSIAMLCDFRTRGSPRGGRGWEGRAVDPKLDTSIALRPAPRSRPAA